ncbi:predicted protein [Lichtheimia corymbifera JMRC:FSU:9682]|uniref:C2H2-type domain-containing protein n=1 Tax=Lichtheimia corymbifera JMRC:FSU:9682 TaxID=1263082 RepID=A0A068RRZ3_9FUNG|nr:predicted protein [Lichtheimia corymbifera JMRC:FSU:9682]
MIPTPPCSNTYAGSSPSVSPPPSPPSHDGNMLHGSIHSYQGSNNKRKRLYQCSYCEKSFTKPSALQPHIYTHTGEKPFVCHFPGCNRGFAVISNLRRHFKVHEPKANDSTRMSPQERVMRVYRLATLSQEMNQDPDDGSISSLPYVEQQQPTTTNSTNTTTVPTSAPSLPFVSTSSSLPSFSSPTYHHHRHYQQPSLVTKDTPFPAPSLPTCSALIPPTAGVFNTDPYTKRL